MLQNIKAIATGRAICHDPTNTQSSLVSTFKYCRRCSGKSSTERKRFYEIARGSLIEIDTALDIAINLKYLSKDSLKTLGEHIINTFKQLTGMIGGNN